MMRLFLTLTFCVIAMSHSNADEKCPELTGKVVRKQDSEYDKARLVSNYYTSKNSFPEAIVYCKNGQDVQNAVRWAKCHHRPIRVRSGGHNHEGFSTGSKALLIDVSQMKELHIDKAKGQAKIQPGITGGELYSRLYNEGFTQVGGTCGDVGISGLVLTGGMGPLFRLQGLTCDTLVSFDMVDAEGNLIHATKDNEHKDLFWACCGGGAGNFGVLTSLTLRIYPAKKVTWFNIGWDWSQPVDQIISGWQEFFKNEDKKWFSHLDVWAKPFPTDKLKKQPIKILGVYYGTPEDAERELAPLLNIGKPNEKVIELVDWNRSIKEFEDATAVFLTDKPEYKSTGAFAMQPLPPEGIKIVVDTLRNTSSPLLNVLLFSLGGAGAEKSPTETAYFYRKAKFFVCYSSQWLNEKDDLNHIKEVDRLRTQMLPYAQGDYVGNPDRSLTDYLKEYYGDNVARLKQVKKKYDPNNLFRHEQGL